MKEVIFWWLLINVIYVVIAISGREKMTNYEKVKNMTFEEIANLIDGFECDTCAFYCSKRCFNNKCFEGVKEWLKQEESTES